MGALQDFHKWRCMRLVHAEVFAQVDRAVWDEVFVKRPDLLQGAASDSARAVCRRRQVFSSRLCSSSADACLRVVWVCCVCQTCTPTTLTRRGCPSPRSRWRTMRKGRAGRRSTTAGWGRGPTLPVRRCDFSETHRFWLPSQRANRVRRPHALSGVENGWHDC